MKPCSRDSQYSHRWDSRAAMPVRPGQQDLSINRVAKGPDSIAWTRTETARSIATSSPEPGNGGGPRRPDAPDDQWTSRPDPGGMAGPSDNRARPLGVIGRGPQSDHSAAAVGNSKAPAKRASVLAVGRRQGRSGDSGAMRSARCDVRKCREAGGSRSRQDADKADRRKCVDKKAMRTSVANGAGSAFFGDTI